MIKHIRIRTFVIFHVLFIASFITPLPVRTKGGIRMIPAAILDWYSVILDDFRYLDSQEQLHIVMSFLFFLIVHLTIVTLISIFISRRLTALVRKCKPGEAEGEEIIKGNN